MAYRVILSDGTTSVDMWDGSDAKVRYGGLVMPPPRLRSSYITGTFHGGRLASSYFENRQIVATIKIWGSSLADLKTNVRTIERLLNDARQHTISGYGTGITLEYQWGDSAGESTFFDVLEGELALPNDFLSAALDQFYILNATLSLICKPFGRYTNQDIATATLENEQDSPALNYMDIATAEAYGDVPARMYIKIAQTGATGSQKLWIAKRSGVRSTDALWKQGEAETDSTDIIGSPHSVTFSDVADAACSDGNYRRTLVRLGAAVGAAAEVARHNYTITCPKGQFRVLARCRTSEQNNVGEYAKMGWGVGYGYGNKTYSPIQAMGEYVANTANNTWEILDLGILRLPPASESDIAANSSLSLRIFQVVNQAVALIDAWVSPTGHVDAGGVWANETNAYDGNDATYSTVSVPAGGWCDYIELTHAAMYSAGLKVLGNGNDANARAYITQIDIDAYYSGGWHDVYEGTFTHNAWLTKYLGSAQEVSSYRIRYYNSNLGTPYIMKLYEVYYQQCPDYRWELDWLFLLPIDEGVVIINDVADTDIIAIDGITDPPAVFKIDGSGNILDTPDYVGAPFDLGREDTRIYVLRNDVKGVTFAVDVKYQPQFMHI
jgi:hypothetical protein